MPAAVGGLVGILGWGFFLDSNDLHWGSKGVRTKRVRPLKIKINILYHQSLKWICIGLITISKTASKGLFMHSNNQQAWLLLCMKLKVEQSFWSCFNIYCHSYYMLLVGLVTNLYYGHSHDSYYMLLFGFVTNLYCHSYRLLFGLVTNLYGHSYAFVELVMQWSHIQSLTLSMSL